MRRSCSKRSLTRNYSPPMASTGFSRRTATDDDIIVYADVTTHEELARLHNAAPAEAKSARQAAAWRSPTLSRRARAAASTTSARLPSRTGPLVAAELAERFEREQRSNTTRLWLKALADRLAEAFAEYLQCGARAELGLRQETRSSVVEDLIRGEISRHPSRAGLSRPARSHRKADYFRSARTSAKRPA